MKFKTQSSELIKVINEAAKIAVKNNIHPIFECVNLKLDNHILIVRTSNIEIIFEKNINVVGEINGEVFVRAEILNKILNNIEKDINLSIEKNGNLLLIKSEKNEIEIDLFGENEKIPNAPQAEESVFAIENRKLIDNIRQVAFCAAKSEIKPEIASVYIYNKEDSIFFVSTDSYRLAEKKINGIESIRDFNFIIPIKSVLNILSILEEEKDEEILQISTHVDGLLIENESMSISLRLVNGNYPDYKQLFPKEVNNTFELDRGDLIKALQLNNLITTQYNFSKIKFDYEGLRLNVSAEEKSRGNIKRTVSFEYKNKDDTINEVNYNTNYFLEGLQKMNSPKITMMYTGENRPVLIRSNNDLSFHYLLMALNR